jgi:periplasmic protein TonB
MSIAGQAAAERHWPAALRWAACFALVLGVHAAAAAALIGHWRTTVEPLADAPAVLVDLAPAPAAPSVPPREVAPGPQQMQAPAVPQRTATPKPETIPLPQAEPQLREVVLPPRRPAETPHPSQPRQQAHLTSAPSAAAHKAAHTVAPAPGAHRGDPRAVPNWKSALVARLEHYKRYPAEARARGVEGVAQLAFNVDRGGRVHRARIARSSGSGLLDRATLALIERAQPLPPPPAQLRGAQIAITVPIRYSIR